MRARLSADGSLSLGERFTTLVAPGRPIGATISRLTGIRDADLVGAPPPEEAVSVFRAFAFAEGEPTFVGHNVSFDLAFLERAGLPASQAWLDTAELASVVLPGAPSYALQRLAADAAIARGAAHRALDDALTCAAVLGELAKATRSLPPLVLEEAQAYAALLGGPAATFFAAALGEAARRAWSAEAFAPAVRSTRRAGGRPPDVAAAFAPDGPLARSLAGYEDRPQQRTLALAVERTFAEGGVLVAEAGAGVGKSLAYLVAALARAIAGERVVISTQTLPLQDQLVRKDLPVLQATLGTEVAIAVLKGRANYLCPRRWQLFRAAAATREEARLVLKTLVWRTKTTTGDRAELNLLSPESDLWPRISADDQSCDTRRCARTAGGCFLERARAFAAEAGIVIVNHALLLQDARLRNALLPEAEHVVIDEAHRLEEVASDAFGFLLEEPQLRRDFDRLARSPLVIEALRDPAHAATAEALRTEIEHARERAADVFGALGALLTAQGPLADDRLRVTRGVRAAEELWLPIEIAGERLADALAAIATAADQLSAPRDDPDETVELRAAAAELANQGTAITRGIHSPRADDVVWVDRDALEPPALHVAPAYVGDTLRRTLVEPHRSAVFTSATLAVAGSLRFACDRFGVADVADTLAVGSPFHYPSQATLVIPTDIALPQEETFVADAAAVIAEIARALGGRTLALFTAHGMMRDVAVRLAMLDDANITVLTQGLDGSRRALLERFAVGRAVLLGTQSFWEGVDLPGDQLGCVVVARLPFAVPDDPLVQARAERYEDPFREFHVPQAALRLRQGFGRLIRTKRDRGAVVLLDRRVLTQEYGPVLLSSLPDARLVTVPQDEVAAAVLAWCERGSP